MRNNRIDNLQGIMKKVLKIYLLWGPVNFLISTLFRNNAWPLVIYTFLPDENVTGTVLQIEPRA